MTEPASTSSVDVVAQLAEIRSDLRFAQESIRKCEGQIEAVEIDLSGTRARLSELGKGSENDTERVEMHATIARLEATMVRLSSKEASLL